MTVTITKLKCVCNDYVMHPPYLCGVISRENQSLGMAPYIMTEEKKIQKYYDIFRLVVVLSFIGLVLYFAR